jgi:hypothetical protein
LGTDGITLLSSCAELIFPMNSNPQNTELADGQQNIHFLKENNPDWPYSISNFRIFHEFRKGSAKEVSTPLSHTNLQNPIKKLGRMAFLLQNACFYHTLLSSICLSASS